MKNTQLKVHVLNAGEGDSILIEFPNNIWGIADSNRKHKRAPIPALEFLKKMEKLDRPIEEPMGSYVTATIDAYGNVTTQPENVYEFVDIDTIQFI